jgi:hypothetical protein
MEKIILDGKEITIRRLAPKDLKDAKKFADYINDLIEEDVYLSVNKKYSLRDETVFLKSQIEKIKRKIMFFWWLKRKRKLSAFRVSIG